MPMSIGGSRFAHTTSPVTAIEASSSGKFEHQVDQRAHLFDARRLDADTAQRDVLDAMKQQHLVAGVVDVGVDFEAWELTRVLFGFAHHLVSRGGPISQISGMAPSQGMIREFARKRLANLARCWPVMRLSVRNALRKPPLSGAVAFWNGSCTLGGRMRRRNQFLMAAAMLFSVGAGACAHTDYFPGTTILRTEDNVKIVETLEQYRRRLLEHNVDGLLVLASQTYFEDSGTPRSDDDYGYEGLKQVLGNKLKLVKSLRYEIEYRNITVKGNRAEVEVFLDGSFDAPRRKPAIATAASTTTTASCSSARTISGSSSAGCDRARRGDT